VPKNMGATSTLHLVLFGDGTHSEGDTNTTHSALGVLSYKSPSVGEIGERHATSSRCTEYPGLKHVSALAFL
jgi:hypothetical protein